MQQFAIFVVIWLVYLLAIAGGYHWYRLRIQELDTQIATLKTANNKMCMYLENIADPRMQNTDSMKTMARLGLNHEILRGESHAGETS